MELLTKRYLFPGESPAGMFRRVSRYLDMPDSEDLMLKGKFIPNSPTLMNAGRKGMGQLSACFVLPIHDNMNSIYDTLKHTAMIHKSGGGTGFDFSELRPDGDSVSNTNGVASGPVSFLRVYDVGTEVVKQGGLRRGANMGMLRVDHPDILDFIKCKTNEGHIKNFNLSIAITDKFMDALKSGRDYDLINPRNGEVWQTIPAVHVWEQIIEQAWLNGEPGIFFVDTVNRFNPHPDLGRLETCNPCGETPLLPYESCVLGSVNLAAHVEDYDDFAYDDLENSVRIGVEFLNSVLLKNEYPIPQIKEASLRTHKIGLGVMGWADALVKLGIRYDEPESLKVAGEVSRFIQKISHEQSDGRNMTVTTIAPTGSISIIASCSSGIEPIFALSETRRHADMEYTREHPLLDSYKRENFVTAHEIPWEMHVAHQAEFQKSTDNAISKTINMPNSATRADVARAIFCAYDQGCKGITMYRDGSRTEQVLSRGMGFVQECKSCKI